jgi:polysaccharide deacetylase 2 family uncharacterized protein YibQ
LFLSPPFLTIWVVAFVILASLLIWAKTDKHSSKKPDKEPIRTAQPAAAPAKAPPPAPTPKTDSQVVAKGDSDKAADRPAQPAKPSPASPRDPPGNGQPQPAAVQAAARPPTAEMPPLFEEYQHIRRESLRDNVENLLREFFKTQSILDDQVRRRQVKQAAPDGAIWYEQEIEVQCGAERDLAALTGTLLQKLAALGHDVDVKADGSNPQRLRVTISIHRRPSYQMWFAGVPASPQPQDGNALARVGVVDKGAKGRGPTPPVAGLPPLGKVAIVIDDLGVDLKVAKDLLSIPLALTFSVMPQQSHSREISQLAHDRGREVLVHLPMEPHGYPQVNPGPGVLLRSMGGDRMRQALQNALASVPYASGVNNHMGSTFTEQAEPMKLVLTELRNRGLYFLDRYTTHDSVACDVAAQLQVQCGRRDIFLDHDPKEEFVRSQVQRLIREAKIQGTSVAIGHPHAVTLKVLQQEFARFAEERVAVVPLREVLRQPSPLRRGLPH